MGDTEGRGEGFFESEGTREATGAGRAGGREKGSTMRVVSGRGCTGGGTCAGAAAGIMFAYGTDAGSGAAGGGACSATGGTG
ncbi:hypothetical protein, partial [Novacetimonas maltaceti]